MATPWKPPPPPMPRSNDDLRHRPLTDAQMAWLRAEFERMNRGPATLPLVLPEGHRWELIPPPPPRPHPSTDTGMGSRTVRARRVWRPLEDTAARFAAPWLAPAWVLTAGRMGAPLYRWEIPDPFADREWVPGYGPHGYVGPADPKPPTAQQVPATPPGRRLALGYQPLAGGTNPDNPPTSGSGVPLRTVRWRDSTGALRETSMDRWAEP